MKEQAAIDLLSDEELHELAQKLCNCPDDLIQEVVLLLLEMPEEKWQQINEGGYLRFYIVRTMMTMATRLAEGTPATPTLVAKARTTIVNCSANPREAPMTCATNNTATHSYRAVPSMFTVAPSGKTKLEVRLETPALSCRQRMVTGRVAEDDAVENEVRRASFIATKWRQGCTRPTRNRSVGSTTNMCKPRARRTATT